MTMCSTSGAGEDGVERGDKVVGDGAAETAVRKLDDVLFRAGFVAAAFQDFAVDTDVTELVDDDSKSPSLRMGQNMADQRRFSRAEKAGHNGAGYASE